MQPLPLKIAVTVLTAVSCAAIAAAPATIALPAGFPAVLYLPEGTGPHSGVVVLHGIEGGAALEAHDEAEFLANQGFVSLALCSYGCHDPRVPEHLNEVDLSQTYEALRWLRASAYVQGRPVALDAVGAGRGAEQALALSVYLSKHTPLKTPNALLLHAPSDRIGWGESDEGHSKIHRAWSWQGSFIGLQPGTLLNVQSYSGALFVTHGNLDLNPSVAESHQLETHLVGAGSAVREYDYSQDLSIPPTVVGPSGNVRAEFHYFEGEGHNLGSRAAAIRRSLEAEFLKNALGD